MENIFIDEGNSFKISYIKKEENKDFILNSILKSIERFGNTLNITGDEKFKKTILDTVNEHNLNVIFVDKTMENININNKLTKLEKELKDKFNELIHARNDFQDEIFRINASLSFLSKNCHFIR